MTHQQQIQKQKTPAQASSKASVEAQSQDQMHRISRTEGAKTMTTEAIFSAGDVIYSYSRAQAIADGVLVDVTDTAREAGFKIPVAITRAAWADCVEWTAEIEARKETTQDESGRLWDVVWMAFVACRAPGEGQRRVFELYRVPREGRGNRPRRVSLAVCIGPGDDHSPAITIMQPNED
jgi:hypothetical protein